MPSDWGQQLTINRALIAQVERELSDGGFISDLMRGRTTPSMTLCQVPNNVLTVDALRQIVARFNCPIELLHPPQHRTATEVRLREAIAHGMFVMAFHPTWPKPCLSEVRSWVTHSDHGLANVCNPHTGHDRMFLSMGCVKTDDETPNWNTEAMAKGTRWPR